MPTLLTDPRSGGVKKKSGVNVSKTISETWAKVRNDADETSYLLASYAPNSKTDVELYEDGTGGIKACCENLPDDKPCFGGAKLGNGRFVSFVYIGVGVGIMLKGRASMHKNGVLNLLEGCDTEIEVWKGMREEDVGRSKDELAVRDTDSFVRNRENEVTVLFNDDSNKQNQDSQPKESPVSTPTPSPTQLASTLKESNPNDICNDFNQLESVPYSKLKDMNDPSKYGIDPAKKELALSDVEFMELFQMDKASWEKIAGWKQKRLKKELSLF